MAKLKEEESIFRKRLLYDGHGLGEDRRILAIIRSVTKLTLGSDLDDEKLRKDLAAAVNSAERHDKIEQMYERTFDNLERAITEKEKAQLDAKEEVENLKLEVLFMERLQEVQFYPDCNTTEALTQDLNRRKQSILAMIDKQKDHINTLAAACKSLQRVLDDGDFSDIQMTYEKINDTSEEFCKAMNHSSRGGDR